MAGSAACDSSPASHWPSRVRAPLDAAAPSLYLDRRHAQDLRRLFSRGRSTRNRKDSHGRTDLAQLPVRCRKMGRHGGGGGGYMASFELD